MSNSPVGWPSGRIRPVFDAMGASSRVRTRDASRGAVFRVTWARRATPAYRPKHPSGAFTHPTNFLVCLSLSLFLLPYSLLPTRHSLFCLSPDRGWAERRQTPGVSGHPRPEITLQTRHPAGCLPPSAKGGAPLGAPPWRFWAGGRASFSGISSGSVQRAPRSQVVVPGGRDPGPLEPAVASRSRETPLLAPPSGSPLEDAPHERG
jgi:hypothetical protein